MNRVTDDWDNTPGFDPKKEEYIHLDLDQWLKKHKISDEGRKSGAQNLPSTDSNELDACEEKIRSWINRRGRVCRQNVSGHLSDLERQLSDMENDQELDTLQQKVLEIKEDAGLKLELKAREGRNTLHKHETAVSEATQDFARFRKEAGLTRLADYSHRDSAKWFIVICVIVESALNATLLMDVSTFGLLGSIVQMGLISVVNILITALAMGALLRQRNNISVNQNHLVWTGITLIILFSLVFNILVGHFRDSMQQIISDTSINIYVLGGDTMARMMESPLGFESFQSLFLALLGFLFFTMASWKWYQRDDPYPDYGRRHRELKGLEENYIEMYEKVHGNLENVFKDYISRLEDKRHILEIKQSKWREISLRGKKLVDEYPINLQQYQNDLDHLLSVYRTANKEQRNEPPPSHFSKHVHVDKEILQPLSFTPPVETNITGVTNKVHDAIKQVQNAYQEAARQFRTLEHIKKDSLDGCK